MTFFVSNLGENIIKQSKKLIWVIQKRRHVYLEIFRPPPAMLKRFLLTPVCTVSQKRVPPTPKLRDVIYESSQR